LHTPPPAPDPEPQQAIVADRHDAVLTLEPPRSGRPATSGNGSKRHSDPLDGFPEWYASYPRKEARPHAEKAWRKLSTADRKAALDALDSWPFPQDKKFTPLPASWLNARRWEDEHMPVSDTPRHWK
jgi:hypothetical protein